MITNFYIFFLKFTAIFVQLYQQGLEVYNQKLENRHTAIFWPFLLTRWKIKEADNSIQSTFRDSRYIKSKPLLLLYFSLQI